MGKGKRLSAELIAILAAGAALAGVILSGQSRTDSRIEAVEVRMGALENRMGAFEVRMSGLEQRQARIEGLVQGAALFAARNGSQPEKR